MLSVRFPNIMLPDSASSPLGSIGYIQYEIRPTIGHPNGTIIHNTASIFFDYNAPIVTNTTANQYYSNVGVEELEQNALRLYPNPAQDFVTLESNASIKQIRIIGLDGRLYGTEKVHQLNKYSLSVSNLLSGVYFVEVTTPAGVQTIRFVKTDI